MKKLKIIIGIVFLVVLVLAGTFFLHYQQMSQTLSTEVCQD